MTDTQQGRFGTAAPGATPGHLAVAPLITAEAPPPRARRRARTWLIAGVIALIVAAGLFVGGRLSAPGPGAIRAVLITSGPLPAGARLSAADLRTIQVGAGTVGAGAINPSAKDSLVGLVTASALPQGTIVRQSLLTKSGALPRPGQALVGLDLKPGQVPAGGLTDGEQVLIVLLQQSSSGTPGEPHQLGTATVWDAQSASDSTAATVLVPETEVSQLTQYAAQGQVALVQTGEGA
jgi:hypothetical protein